MSANFATAAALASRQNGRVAWRQLVAAGINRHTIQRWLRDGRLHRVHHGVYAVGHLAPSLTGAYTAAVLACGAGAVISHRAAAHLMGLVRGTAPPPEVTVPTTAGRRRPGIVIHRVAALDVRDVSMLDDVPITTVARILLDLAPRTSVERLTRMCHEAWVRHRVGRPEIDACIARNPTRKGATRLRLALGGDVILSELERAFLELLRAHGLPLPRTNIDHLGDKVDCRWEALDVTVELLSYRFHATRRAFEQDLARRRRSHHLAFSHGDVFERGSSTIAELRPILDTRPPTADAARGRAILPAGPAP
jgi:hypothetical protein